MAVPGDTAIWIATSLRHVRSSNYRAAGHRIPHYPQPRLQCRNSGDDLPPERLERRDLAHVGHVEDQVLDARLAKITAHPDYVMGAHALRTKVDGAQGRPLYLLVVSTHILTMAFQDLQLVPDRPRPPVGEEVAGVGVLRNQSQSLLLPHAADHDGGTRMAQCRRVVHRLLEMIMLAPIRLGFSRPHLVGDLQGFFQPLEALGGRGERHTQASGLPLVPSRADAEVGAPAREHVEGGDGLQQNARITVVHAGNQGAELNLLGDARQVVEDVIALEHGFLGFAHPPDLEEVIHHPDACEAGLVGGLSDFCQLRSDRTWGVGPSEAWNLQSYAQTDALRCP